ncbi:MAG TPA: CHAT domain-containing protein [Anaerolineae bacterium]|nr:CHAT domain-containing protein [Anaerolineae bacterium]HNU04447.1 CHAT domain-containing protein [Anaerolineae bacterium]
MPAPHPALLQPFLDAVRLRQLDRCATILAELRLLAAADPDLAAWTRYFEGILANERDHDLAAAERIFLDLLDDQPDLELQGRLCLALAVTYRRQNRLQAGLAFCRRCETCYAALGDRAGQAKALKQMAIVLATGFDQSQFGAEVLPQVAAACHQALDLLHEAPQTEENRWLAGTLWNEIGALHRVQRRWDEAAAAYHRYLTINEALGHRLGMGVAYGNLGELLVKLGPERWPEAEDAFRQSLEIARANHDRAQELDSLANLAHLHQQQGRWEDALDAYGAAIALIDALRAGVSTETARAGFMATVTELFANAVLTAVAAGRPDEALVLAEQARARAFLDLLASDVADSRLPATGVLTVSQICQALAPDEVLLAYFTTGLMAAPAGREAESLDRHRFPPASTLIFIVTRGGVAVVTGDASPNDLQPRRLAGAAERHFLQPAVRRTLYGRLIAPAARLLAGKRRVIIVPHGPLHYVPFQALIAPDGETLLRPGGPELLYGPSASVLFRDRAAAQPLGFRQFPRIWETPCLALGYDGEGDQRLRFAEEEASRIAALLGGEALVGPAGKREALLQRGPVARYLHISCHGQFDPAAPLESSLHLGAGEKLTAREALASLRLRCDLATLSACESGLSQVRRGDELMGLVRAFLAAGAPAVIATLWRVDERSTRLLMERFYREVAAGAGFAGALQQAQLYLRELGREEALALLGKDTSSAGWAERPFADPFYWAPFVLVGGGR